MYFQVNPNSEPLSSPFSTGHHITACLPGSNIVLGAYRIFEGFTHNGANYGVKDSDHLRFRVTQVLVGLAEVCMLGWIVHSVASVYLARNSVTSSEEFISESFSPTVFPQDDCDQGFVGTFPAPLPKGPNYYFFYSSSRLSANFDANKFNNWRNNKSSPILIGVKIYDNTNSNHIESVSTTTEGLFMSEKGEKYIEGEPVPLLILYTNAGKKCLNSPEVADINKRLIERLHTQVKSPEVS